MSGVVFIQPILIEDENGHLLSITSTGSAKVVLTSSGNVQTTVTNTPNVHVTNIPSVIVTSSGILQTSVSNTPNVHVTNTPNVIISSSGIIHVIVTSTGVIPVSQSGTWNLNNITGTISLPTGASTSTGQATTNSKLDTIDTDIKASQPRKLQDGSGNAITSTSTGVAKRSLDVNVANIPRVIISSTGVIPVSQSGTWNLNNITGTISLPTGAATSTGLTTINTTVVNVQGSVSAGTAATKSALIGGQYNSTLPTLTTGQQAAIQVDSRGRVILSSTGAVSSNQGSPNTNANAWPTKITDGTTVVGVSTNAEMRSSDTVNHGGVNGAITVGVSAVEAKVGASKLTNRKLLTIFHNGSNNLYWGYSNAVTTANGTQIFKNTMLVLPVGDGTSIWLISNIAGQDVRITEGA